MLDRTNPQPDRFSFANFELGDMIACGRRLRAVTEKSGCMEDAAQRVVEYLHGAMIEQATGESSCALVRCFKTHALGSLPEDLATAARSLLRGDLMAQTDIPCLTLLGSSGELREWQTRHGSEGHRAIPLESVAVVERAPMIAQLIQQMGLTARDVLKPTREFLLDAEQRAFNIFYVPEARGSEFVPAQGFVELHGIRSVLGFGGLLPSGDLFAVILFSREPIPRHVAEMFRTIALSTKLVLLPFLRGPVFREEVGRAPILNEPAAEERQRAEIATLHLLIPALEDVALQQTARLKLAAAEAQQRTDEIRELNAVLERRVADRTAALVEANEELNAFSYSVSHDLRAPLRTIDGFSAALEEDCAATLGEAGRDHLKRIRAAAQRMGQLIDAMLQLSRVVRVEPSRSTFDLSELARTIAKELFEPSPSRNVRFDIQPGLTVRADPDLMRPALQNLLGNALKFTSRTPAAVIAFGYSPERGAFFVKDNGAGFDMRRSDKLFQPFSRLHTAQQFEGTGIGLATVARIVRRHGGAIWAESSPGEGATFWFRLEESNNAG